MNVMQQHEDCVTGLLFHTPTHICVASCYIIVVKEIAINNTIMTLYVFALFIWHVNCICVVLLYSSIVGCILCACASKLP
jgi:hypothetical protein